MARFSSVISSEALLAATAVVVFSGLVVNSAAAQELGLGLENAEEAADTLLLHRLVVYEDGSSELETSGSPYVELENGEIYLVDLDELTDPDGNRYMVVGDSYQTEEDAPIVHEIRLSKFEPELMSEEYARERYQLANANASEQEIEEFLVNRASALEMQELPSHIDVELEEWNEIATPDDSIELTLLFHEQSSVDIPNLDNAHLEDEPALWMAIYEERMIAIETLTTQRYEYQDEFIAEYMDLGVSDIRNYWIFNGMRAVFSRDAVDELLLDSRLRRIEVVRETEALSNSGAEIIEATQIKQYYQDNFDGHRNSNRSPITNDIFGLIFDDSIVQNHVLWRDGAGTSSRLIEVYRDNDGNGLKPSPYTTQTGGSMHGNIVATQFVADLTDGQDAGITDPYDRLQKTGTTTETSFVFVMQYTHSDIPEMAELAKVFNVDIVNISRGTSDEIDCCDVNHTNATAINGMMYDGIFVVVSAGNENDDYPTHCNTSAEAAASGSFAVAAYDVTDADLNSADIEDFSSRGEDLFGRPIVQLTAPSGRQGAHFADVGGGYFASGGTGTSYAAPLVAGAAADLKDFLIAAYGTTHANKVGLMFAHMLVMGDGQLEDGVQTETTPVDPRWGVGRMRMRLFNGPGMDHPWRVTWVTWTHEHGEVLEFPINYNPNTQDNETIPSEAEWLRAALWFNEPNLGLALDSEVSLTLEEDGGTESYTCSSTAPQSQRLWSDDIANRAWNIEVDGLSIPTSADPDDPFYGLPYRRMHLVVFWEDRARNDENGPHPSDNIY